MSVEEEEDGILTGIAAQFAVYSSLDGDMAGDGESLSSSKPPLPPLRGPVASPSGPKPGVSRFGSSVPTPVSSRGRTPAPGVVEDGVIRRPPGSRSGSQDGYEGGSGLTPLKAPGAPPSRVSVRLGQPVQGCEVEPYILARDHTGSILSKEDPRIKARWLRSNACTPCANPRCSKAATDAGHTLQSTVQCLTCLRLSLPLGSSFFCSIACLKSCWALHRAYHSEPGARPDSAMCYPFDKYDQMPWKSFEFVNRYRAFPGRASDDAWNLLTEGLVFVPSRADVGHRIRLEVALDDDVSGSSSFATAAAATGCESATTRWTIPHPPPCPPRKFTFTPPRSGVPPSRGDAANGDRSHSHSIRILTYNVLAEIFATQSQYPYCPLWALRWSYRRLLLLAELKARDADIICLQEVQADHFENYFHPQLAALGYEGLYKQKTREAMGVEGKVDGCAMFFKKARFNLSEKYVIEFNDAAMAESQKLKASQPPTSGSRKQHELPAALHRLLRDNVAQVVLLELVRDPSGGLLPSSQPLVIANTHLFWDPEFADVKLWQTHMLVKELEKFTTQRNLPLMLCGDFNSAAGSSVYKLLSGNVTSGALRSALQPEDLPPDPCNILTSRGKLSHSLFLSSAYSVVTGNEPAYTNYTGDFVGCLDYLWFTSNSMRVVTALEIPTEEAISGYSGSALPNQQYASDHICLCFDMVLGQPQNNIPDASTAPTAASAAPPVPPMPAPSPGDSYAHHQMAQQQQAAATRAAILAGMQQQQQQFGRPVLSSSRLGATSMPYVPRSTGDSGGRFG